MPQHVVVGVAEDLLDLQADPLGEPVEIEQKVVKWHAAPEDTRSHIGRPFEKHAELEAVRERKLPWRSRWVPLPPPTGRVAWARSSIPAPPTAAAAR
ncbi:hypothetical protein AB0H30_33890 [Streptomyces pseudogriseolus]|uniref:hypothetical protein n=1 Tax=Streptomyces pseudogriseolus TaxID=36817 RepID=UPI003498F96A